MNLVILIILLFVTKVFMKTDEFHFEVFHFLYWKLFKAVILILSPLRKEDFFTFPGICLSLKLSI